MRSIAIKAPRPTEPRSGEGDILPPLPNKLRVPRRGALFCLEMSKYWDCDAGPAEQHLPLLRSDSYASRAGCHGATTNRSHSLVCYCYWDADSL